MGIEPMRSLLPSAIPARPLHLLSTSAFFIFFVYYFHFFKIRNYGAPVGMHGTTNGGTCRDRTDGLPHATRTLSHLS